jgi:hypothetical protein
MAIPQLSVDDLYREEVMEARQMTPELKLTLGLELFDRVRELMIAGIRHQYPEADEDTVRRLYQERLELAERLENTP